MVWRTTENSKIKWEEDPLINFGCVTLPTRHSLYICTAVVKPHADALLAWLLCKLHNESINLAYILLFSKNVWSLNWKTVSIQCVWSTQLARYRNSKRFSFSSFVSQTNQFHLKTRECRPLVGNHIVGEKTTPILKFLKWSIMIHPASFIPDQGIFESPYHSSVGCWTIEQFVCSTLKFA